MFKVLIFCGWIYTTLMALAIVGFINLLISQPIPLSEVSLAEALYGIFMVLLLIIGVIESFDWLK